MIQEKGLFLRIKDKTNLEGELFCPPHCIPHKLPFTKPIERERESCHFHSSKLRMLHHRLYCYLIRCPNYQKMMQDYRKENKKE